MRYLGTVLLILLLCAGCGQASPAPEAPAETRNPPPEEEQEEQGDFVLLTLEAPLADGRSLTLEAVGKVEDEYTAGVREVRVYDGEELVQTVPALDGIRHYWGGGDLLPGEEPYTRCWKPEGSMEVLDLNFDGNTDFGLFGWCANNTIPYYYWIWNPDTAAYQYAFVLQEAEAHPETRELTSEYKSGSAGSQWIKEVYGPGGDGKLYLDRVERDTCDFEPEPPSYLDFDRGWAHEIWLSPEDREPISPRDDSWSLEADLILTRREVPVYEDNGDGTVSHFTEIWEFWDGEPQLVQRKEYAYENQS